MNPTRIILPGSTIGILGSGQLGRMLALAAREMGYRVRVYSPDSDSPAGQVADQEVTASYDDLDRVRTFARGVDVITFEFENVPAATAQVCAEQTVVRPSGEALHTTQNRLREKTFLQDNGLPVAPFVAINSLADLEEGIKAIGAPSVLKSAGFGYDGKGQRKIASANDAVAAWRELNVPEAILEAFVDFAHEASVVAARDIRGRFTSFGLVENIHRNHILDFSIAPARINGKIAATAVEMTREIMERLDFIGVLCVECFVTADGALLVNELAPRPHNSGHFTIDACVTSQFEQQLRAVCGLPLGSTELLQPAAMANLLGDIWDELKGKAPNWEAVCAMGDVAIHLYGKADPRPGRKMGHLTALGVTPDEALATVTKARELLRQ